MKKATVVLITPLTYEDHLLIQKHGSHGKKYGDIAMETIAEQGHIWDRYAYAPNDPFITANFLNTEQ